MKTNHEMENVELATKAYADARATLNDMVDLINCQVENIYRHNAKNLKKLVGTVVEREAKLKALIEAHPDLFERPRTQVFHGIKVGYRKGKGGMDWEDEEQVLKLIKKHFPEMEDVLIKTLEEPNKSALAELPASDLKRLGITMEDTGDQVTVKPTDSAVDKAVKALLKSAAAELEEAA